MMTNDDNPSIPKGKARLRLDNNGWVGTSNGWPLVGQPALFPESQALELSTLWNLALHLGPEKLRNLFPAPEKISTLFDKWVGSKYSVDHTD